MTPQLLKLAGEALYGPQWHKPIAADLNVSDRTIRRWIAGSFQIPESIAVELVVICSVRIETLRQLKEQL